MSVEKERVDFLVKTFLCFSICLANHWWLNNNPSSLFEMSCNPTAACPHHWSLPGIQEHGNRNAYNVLAHELAKANKYRTISMCVLKYSRGYIFNSITQELVAVSSSLDSKRWGTVTKMIYFAFSFCVVWWDVCCAASLAVLLSAPGQI